MIKKAKSSGRGVADPALPKGAAPSRKQKRRPAGPTGPIVDFLRAIPHTGPGGFEGLVAALLEAATGQRFRIAGSGFQEGMDIASETGVHRGNRIKTEVKHYFRAALDLRELTAEIAQAAKIDLDLWVLAATCPLLAQHAIELEEQALDRGVECLFLDRPDQGLARLDVLMAAHPDVVDAFGRVHGGAAFDSPALRGALSDIAAQSKFQAAQAQIVKKLEGTLLGYDDARRRASAFLHRTLRDAGSALAAFNQRLGLNDPSVRKVERLATLASLDEWWRNCGIAGRHGVVLGEIGTGKSWATFDWLDRQLCIDDFPLIAPLAASATPILDGETIETLLPRVLTIATGLLDEARWAARLSRWLATPGQAGPLILAVVDGLNEKPELRWPSFFRTLQRSRWRGQVLALATDRPGHWTPECQTLESDGFARISVERYNDAELERALSGRGIRIENIPDGSLQDLIRTPLYCDLACEHLPEMMAQGDPTVERLFLLDMRHRRSLKPGFPLSEDEFTAIVIAAAERYRAGPERLSVAEAARLSPLPDHRREIYHEIVSGGLLVRKPGSGPPSFMVERTRLVYGLGMLLAEDVRQCAGKGQDATALREQIGSWLEPHPEIDLKVDVLGSALFHAYLDEGYPKAARQELLAGWLRARNRSAPSQAAFAEYVLRRPEDFVAMVDRFWTYAENNGNAQEFLARAFLRHRDEPRLQRILAEAIYRWMGVLHPFGYPLLRHEEAAAERMRSAIEGRVGHKLQPGFLMMLGERLTVVEEDGLLRLRRLGFLIMSAGARTPFARGLVSWAVASAVSGSAMEADVADWVVRLADDAKELEGVLLSEAQRLIELGDLGRTAAHILLRRLGTNTARDLAAQHPEPESDEIVRRRAAHAANPCDSMFAWSEEELRICMARPETRLSAILGRIKTSVLNPAWELPLLVTNRATAALQDIGPLQVHGSFDATIETARFEDLLPVLASRAPTALAQYLRTVVRTLPARDLEGQRQLAIWLCELSPLLGSAEISLVQQTLGMLRAQATAWSASDEAQQENTPQIAEAFLTLALLPQLEPSQRWDELLVRPHQARDLFHLARWLAPVSRDRVENGLRTILEGPEDRRLERVLLMLPAVIVPADLSPADRERLLQLAGSSNWSLRALVLRYACLADDEEVGRAAIDLGGIYRDVMPMWEMEWGARAILRFSEHLTFEEAAARVHPATAGRLLLARGRKPKEVELYAKAIDEGLQAIARAPDPSGTMMPPAVRVPDPQKSLGNDFPSLEPVPRSEISLRSADESWSSGDEDHLERLQKMLDSLATGGNVVHDTRRRRESIEALRAAWGTDAQQWFGRSFDPDSLAVAVDADPRRLAAWADYALDEGPDGWSARLRLGSFFGALCEVALDREPSLGLRLWRRLRAEPSNPARIDLDALPFRVAKRSPECDEARAEVLQSCADDEALAHLAITAQTSGADDWLSETIERLVTAPAMWHRAVALCLAGWSHLLPHRFEAYVAAAEIENTWVEDLVSRFQTAHQQNLWSRSWYERFLADDDPDNWWSALQACLLCGDSRFGIWRGEAEGGPATDLMRKTSHLVVIGDRLRRALDRSRERERTYLGVKVLRGEVFPFTR